MAWPLHILAVGGIVEDGHGNVLLLNHPRRGWEFPGGQVEEGEDLMQALAREILEESGVEARVERLIGVYSNTRGYMGWDGVTPIPTKLMLDFTCALIGGELRVSEEHTQARWVPRDQALSMMTARPYIERYRAYLAFEGRVTYAAYVAHPDYEESLRRPV